MGFPSLRKVADHYKKNPNVISLAVQTVFEGQNVNTFDKLAPTARRFNLTDIPFGHDPGDDGKRSNILKRYRTHGTPWDIVIDPKGIIRYSTFTRGEGPIIAAIDKILADNDMGNGLIGSKAPSFAKAKWVGKRSLRPYRSGHAVILKLWRGTDEDGATIRDLAGWVGQSKKLSMILIRVPGEGGKVPSKGLRAEAKALGHKGGLIADTKGEILAQFAKLAGKPSLEALTLVVDGRGKVVWASTDPVMRNVGLLEEGGKAFKALKKAATKVLAAKK